MVDLAKKFPKISMDITLHLKIIYLAPDRYDIGLSHLPANFVETK